MKKLAFAFFLAVVSWSLSAQDVCESNNSFATSCPIDFGNTINALINQAGDNDYYLLNPTEAGVIEVQVQSVPSNIDLDLYLYGPGQGVEEVARYLNGPQGSGFTYWLSICEPGPYYLLLNDNDNDFNASVQYNFVVNFTPFSAVDQCECNNSFNDACPITFGQQESALVAPWFDNNPLTRDDDYYLLNTTEAGLIEVQVLNVPQDIDLDLYIYGPGQGAEEVARHLNAPQGSGFTYRLSICEAGPHYLLLNDNDNDFNGNDQYTMYVDVNCDLINALNGPATDNAIQVFPNPFEGYLFIELPGEAEVRISDLAGKALLFDRVGNAGRVKIDTKHLPAGLLILTVRTGGKQYASKLVKM